VNIGLLLAFDALVERAASHSETLIPPMATIVDRAERSAER
jgi:hypothetical protein